MTETHAASSGGFFGGARNFIKHNAVLVISAIAAAATAFFVPPDAGYLDYPDYKSLVCLFSVLAVVNALRNIGFFNVLAQRVVARFSNLRSCCAVLCTITFLSSMFMVNDMALLTFLPLGALILLSAGREKDLAFLFVMQNFSANLGGMLTPFGNPQNLYLYAKYSLSLADFLIVMLPPLIISGVLIAVCIIFIGKEPLSLPKAPDKSDDIRLTVVYLILLALAIAMVFKLVPYPLGGITIGLALLFFDRRVFLQLDWALLATFLAFFVFAGNMARIGAVRDFLSAMLEKSTFLVSIAASQVISNVPAAILLSQFSDNWRALLLGVNIGGTGTLVASLASLITLSEYRRQTGTSAQFLRLFILLNIPFLVVLAIAGLIEVHLFGV
jgi:Na+/H+ antiporter NhaD/arsenite permease-like protein